MQTNIIGYNNLKRFFKNIIERKTPFPQSLLLYGYEGSGKYTLLKDFILSYLCQEKSGCKNCHNCKLILKKEHPDVLFLPKEKIIKIETIRNLKTFFYSPPSELEEKFLLIPCIENMNINAANSFLKMLEEPPYYLKILATSDNYNSLLPTIKSRFMNYHIPILSDEEYEYFVKKIKPEIKENELVILKHLTHKKPYKTILFLEKNLIFSFRKDFINAFVNFVEKDDFTGLFYILQQCIKQDIEDFFYEYLLLLIRDLIYLKEGLFQFIVNTDILDKISHLKNRFSYFTLWSFLDLIVDTLRVGKKFYDREFYLERILWNFYKLKRGLSWQKMNIQSHY